METQAILRGVHLSAQKGRLVADLVRGCRWSTRSTSSPSLRRRAPVSSRKVLESAIANAEHNDGADIDELKVTTIHVEKGTSLKRFQARAKGRGQDRASRLPYLRRSAS
jgi:large subunit ribosomal protein L22